MELGPGVREPMSRLRGPAAKTECQINAGVLWMAMPLPRVGGGRRVVIDGQEIIQKPTVVRVEYCKG